MRRRTGSVTVYNGKRGKTFGFRYRDADGRRVSETLGSELEGWTEKRAEEEREERRVQVRKEGRRKLEPGRSQRSPANGLPATRTRRTSSARRARATSRSSTGT